MSDMDESFRKNVKRTYTKWGWDYSCRKGLFSVVSGDSHEALNEARNYFRQYYEDGEYDVSENFTPDNK